MIRPAKLIKINLEKKTLDQNQNKETLNRLSNQIRLQSLVFYFSFNVVVVCLFSCFFLLTSLLSCYRYLMSLVSRTAHKVLLFHIR